MGVFSWARYPCTTQPGCQLEISAPPRTGPDVKPDSIQHTACAISRVASSLAPVVQSQPLTLRSPRRAVLFREVGGRRGGVAYRENLLAVAARDSSRFKNNYFAKFASELVFKTHLRSNQSTLGSGVKKERYRENLVAVAARDSRVLAVGLIEHVLVLLSGVPHS